MLLVPALPGRFAPVISFDDARRKVLAATRPDFVFIGNSMVFSRIDLAALATAEGGGSGMYLTGGGLFSAHWYLWFKNELIASGHRPCATFIFFREDELTNPYREVNTPEERALLAKASVDQEQELHQVLALHQPFMDRVESLLYAVYPIQLRRADVEWTLDTLALLPALSGFSQTMWRKKFASSSWTRHEEEAFMASRGAFKREIRDVLFNSNGFRSRPAVRTESVVSNGFRSIFSEQVSGSLLPAMLRLARENGVRLIFVRVKPRPSLDGSHLRRSELEKRYFAELRAYLAINGGSLHDETGDERWLPEHYYDQWHIAPRFMSLYTERFLAGQPDVFARAERSCQK